MSGPFVLLQFGSDPFSTKIEDLEGRAAFTIVQVEHTPNIVTRLTREAEWAQQHPDIMGPSNSFFYFGPSKAPGYLVYGNLPSQAMSDSMRQKKETSTSRYFKSQSGKECKWKPTPRRMECFCGRSTIAVWELSEPEDIFHARLTIKPAGLPIVTEIVTTLTLLRMAQALNW
jgi:hypothetical protein